LSGEFSLLLSLVLGQFSRNQADPDWRRHIKVIVMVHERVVVHVGFLDLRGKLSLDRYYRCPWVRRRRGLK
jgi:hypothetical protein